jgi:predicted RND superfamily exporter protein
MKNFSRTFSVEHPRLNVFLTIIITLAILTQIPKVKTDTNPKNMLPETSAVRVWNDEVEKTFSLYEDMIVVGIVNEKGILNKDTLGKVHEITNEILKLKGVIQRCKQLPYHYQCNSRVSILKVAPLMRSKK